MQRCRTEPQACHMPRGLVDKSCGYPRNRSPLTTCICTWPSKEPTISNGSTTSQILLFVSYFPLLWSYRLLFSHSSFTDYIIGQFCKSDVLSSFVIPIPVPVRSFMHPALQEDQQLKPNAHSWRPQDGALALLGKATKRGNT